MNTIKVTACDNELIIIAFQGGTSFELCRILSGNSKAVNVTLQVQRGQFTGPLTLNGLSNALNATLDVYLDKGSYSLMFLGIDWSGPSQFNVNFNNQAFNSGSLPGVGLVWHPAPVAMTV